MCGAKLKMCENGNTNAGDVVAFTTYTLNNFSRFAPSADAVPIVCFACIQQFIPVNVIFP